MRKHSKCYRPVSGAWVRIPPSALLPGFPGSFFLLKSGEFYQEFYQTHKEFTRAYNQLYGRIRRGKQPDGETVMEQLKAMHDEYTERHENTRKKEREAVWKEYIRKNKELLS